MPYGMRKVNGKNCYRVFNKVTKRVYSKCATQKNAKKQIQLLRAIENNPKFIPWGSTMSRKMRRVTRKNRQ